MSEATLSGRDPSDVAAASEERRYVLNALLSLRRDVQHLSQLARDIECDVAILRSAGASWGDLGMALGITRQAAQQRYGRS